MIYRSLTIIIQVKILLSSTSVYLTYINNKIIWLNIGSTFDTVSYALGYVRNLFLLRQKNGKISVVIYYM